VIFFIEWYLLVTLIGLLSFPIAFRLLPALSDRGYSFSRTLGWLLWGYIFWLLTSLGVLRNSVAGLLFSLAVLTGASALALRGGNGARMKQWLRSQKGLVIRVEVLFLLAFAACAVLRAANPDATGTEKPMELAFINAILHSPTFPPHDPWLSGYAISYYYFGYVLVAMLAKISATSGGVAFNLGTALVFALSALGAYGIVFNLLQARKEQTRSPGQPAWQAFLGPFFVLIVSNLEGFLQVLQQRGLFWTQTAAGQWTSPFWKWLDITDLNVPPSVPFTWMPNKFWWWWRASRVVQDYDFAHNAKEIIDEFPFFSFLLADLHPHVLAMPFAFLAMALALNLYQGGAAGKIAGLRHRFNLRTLSWASFFGLAIGLALIWVGGTVLNLRILLIGLVSTGLGLTGLVSIWPMLQEYGLSALVSVEIRTYELGMTVYLSSTALLLGAVVLGGLAFLNTWDFPVYVALFAGAYSARQMRQSGWKWARVNEFIFLGLLLGISGAIFYLPFYAGFSSQAGGLLPNLIYPTRGAQFWVMFAPFIFPISIFLLYHLWRKPESDDRPARYEFVKGLTLTLGLMGVLWLLALALGIGISMLPQVGDIFMASVAAPGRGELLQQAFQRRLINSGGWLTLGLLLAATLTIFISNLSSHFNDRAGTESKVIASAHARISPASFFSLLLITLGLLLTLAPEFFFLRDQFGWRINTIFKFYFQAWLLWGVAAAYATAVLLHELDTHLNKFNIVFRISLVVILGASLVYPVLSTWSKTNGFNPGGGWTLDGTAYMQQLPDETAAIHWLEYAQPGNVAEAVSATGGSYSEYGRVSMLSGQPALLGWVGHESQWRGGNEEIGSRQKDIELIYCARDWSQALPIVQQYQIRYIYVGGLERSTYQPNSDSCASGLNEAKFRRALTPVFQQGDVTIYEVPGQS
jgi:uncharacterized membrane protein